MIFVNTGSILCPSPFIFQHSEREKNNTAVGRSLSLTDSCGLVIHCLQEKGVLQNPIAGFI